MCQIHPIKLDYKRKEASEDMKEIKSVNDLVVVPVSYFNGMEKELPEREILSPGNNGYIFSPTKILFDERTEQLD